MATLRFTDGPVTVTLDGGLEAFVRKALDAVAGETVRLVEGAAEDLATQAGTSWYDSSGPGVRRRTGRSGRMGVVTTVSENEVRVSVGSLDLDRAKYIHRPGPLSTVVEEVTKAVYEYEKNRAKAGQYFHARKDRPDAGVKAGLYYRIVPSPDANDGKYLLVELVRKPGQVRIKALLPELGRAIADKVGR